jgi:hypothetical protein
MKQQPDKLFQEKLRGYTRPAPPMAWDKIEKQLDRKNNNVIWLRAAAAVLLLMISVPTVYLLLNGTSSQEIAKTNAATNKDSILSLSEVIVTPVLDTNVDPDPNNQNNIKRVHRIPAPVTKVRAEEVAAVVDVPEKNTNTMSTDALADTTAIEFEPRVAYRAPAKEDVDEEDGQSLKLVITAEETTSYFEGEENLLAPEATSKERKTSTFKKLLRKASDLKTNQDPFGELRQKKNEILALNFKSDKKRSQKTN